MLVSLSCMSNHCSMQCHALERKGGSNNGMLAGIMSHLQDTSITDMCRFSNGSGPGWEQKGCERMILVSPFTYHVGGTRGKFASDVKCMTQCS